MVELEYDGGGTLTVNQSRTCGAALASSTLGQNGEDNDSPGQDLDTYTFEGKPGEQGEIAPKSGDIGERKLRPTRTVEG